MCIDCSGFSARLDFLEALHGSNVVRLPALARLLFRRLLQVLSLNSSTVLLRMHSTAALRSFQAGAILGGHPVPQHCESKRKWRWEA